MSGSRFIFKRENSFTPVDVGVNFLCSSDEEDADDDGDDFGFLQDIPYSSSSLDRSSIGSIPWADDAIKKNQLDWERVERMLHGQEELPQELELRNEIMEWQQKFPHLISAKAVQQQEKTFASRTHNLIDSMDLYSISNLSLNTLNDDDDDRNDYDETNATPRRKNRQTISTETLNDITKSRDVSANTTQIYTKPLRKNNKDFQINSVPLRLCQGYESSQTGEPHSTEVKSAAEATVLFPQRRPIGAHSPMDSVFFAPPITPDINRKDVKAGHIRMPPILNVLESKRRFRDLTGNKRSFIQLTHVQQAKSAVATANHSRDWHSAWHLPFSAATVTRRFFNNRNSIILPSIKPQRERESNSSDDNSDTGRYSVSSVSPVEITGVGRRATTRTMILNQTPQRHKFNRDSSLTTTPATTSSTGRSISAALHPRNHYEFNAFLPYSASKFKSFK